MHAYTPTMQTLLLHPTSRGCKCQERREEWESGVVMKPRLVLPQKKGCYCLSSKVNNVCLILTGSFCQLLYIGKFSLEISFYLVLSGENLKHIIQKLFLSEVDKYLSDFTVDSPEDITGGRATNR